ncbi:MAG: hypothetical protein Q7U99_20140 [Rubrivivax sp.]|nr:hypothetical protein [Rubrivivax sp.]
MNTTPSSKTVVALPTGSAGDKAGTNTGPLATGPARSHSAFLPVMLFGLAVLAVLVWQTWLLSTEREALLTAHAGQQQTVDNAGKLRGSLDTLAADTQRLADAGNANAALLVAELKQRGITINPQATTAPAPAAEAAAPPR